ncbi:MAG: polysaccharide biosynthesis/export family protein [Cyanobacteria bacterium P01_C01_bin.121]
MRTSAWLKTMTVVSTALLGSQLVDVCAPAQAQITGQPTGPGFSQPANSPSNMGNPAANSSVINRPVNGNVGLSAANLSGYILGAGDQISLSVIGYPEFTGTTAVLPDGTVTLPLIGPVRTAGITQNQLTAVLTEQMKAYLVDPVVSVSLAVMRPVVVTVSGEVHRPGPLQLSGLSNSNTTTINGNNVTESSTNSRLTTQPAVPTLSSALLLAGGVTRDADIREVVVRRPLPNGQMQVLTFNLWEAIASEVGLADLSLRDGDSIFIPTLIGDAIDRRTVANSSLAPSTVRVKVVGEVVRPGEVEVPPDSSISSAVAIAGGPTEDAQLSNVSLVRQGETGQILQEDVDLSNLVDSYQIQEGDVIVVSKRGYLSVIDGIGRVLNPLNVFRLFGF